MNKEKQKQYNQLQKQMWRLYVASGSEYMLGAMCPSVVPLLNLPIHPDDPVLNLLWAIPMGILWVDAGKRLAKAWTLSDQLNKMKKKQK